MRLWLILLWTIYTTAYGLCQDCTSEVLVTCPNEHVHITIDRTSQCSYNYEIEYPQIDIVIGEIDIQTLINDVDPVSANTSHIELPVGESLLRHVVVDTCGNRVECNQRVSISYDEPDFDCPKDFIFLLDNSGSIGIVNFPVIAESIKKEIDAIGQKFTNSRFAILHYGGTCGDSIWIENDFARYTDIGIPQKKLTFADDLNELLEQIIILLDNEISELVISPIQDINPRPEAELNIVLVTNALPEQTAEDGCSDTALLPYTNLTTLKSSPYDAIFTVVHYATPIADLESAAIASPGGKWQNKIAIIPEDPQNQLHPRRYVPAPFYDYPLNLLHTIPSCLDCTDCNDISSSLSPLDSCQYSLNYINGLINSFDYIHLYTDSSSTFINSQVNLDQGFSYASNYSQDATNIYLSYKGKIPKGIWNDILSFEIISSKANPLVYIEYIRNPDSNLQNLHCLDSIAMACTISSNEQECLVSRDVNINCNNIDVRLHDLDFRFINTSGDTLDSLVLLIDEPLEASFGNKSRDTVIVFDPPLLPDFASNFIRLDIFYPGVLIDSIALAIDLEYQTDSQICRSESFVEDYIIACCELCNNSFLDFSSLDEQCCTKLSLIDGCSYTNFEFIDLHLISDDTWSLARPLDNKSHISSFDSSRVILSSPMGLFSDGISLNIAELCFNSSIAETIAIEYDLKDPLYAATMEPIVCVGNTTIDACDGMPIHCGDISDINVNCNFAIESYNLSITLSSNDLGQSIDSSYIFTSQPNYTGLNQTYPVSATSDESYELNFSIQPINGFTDIEEVVQYGLELIFIDGSVCHIEGLELILPVCEDECCLLENEDYLELLFLEVSILKNDCEVCINMPSLGPCDAIELDIQGQNQVIKLHQESSNYCHLFDQSGDYSLCFTGLRYSAELQNYICIEQDTCLLITVDCMIDPPVEPLNCLKENISINNIITRNDDGINDVLYIKGLKDCTAPSIVIYNRWGQEVYRDDAYANDWKGINQAGERLPDGTYLYSIYLDEIALEISNYVDLRSL